MMRSLLQPLLVLSIPALIAGAALAADPAASLPVVRISLAPLKELDAIAVFVTKLGGKPERVNALHDQVKQMGWGDGAGLDTTKRWGFYAEFPANQVPVIAIMMPVADETKFLAAIKPFFPQQDKEPTGGWKLQNPKMPPFACKLDKGYARISMWRLVELPSPADPVAVVAGPGTLSLIIEASRLGADLKANLVGGMKAFYAGAGMPPEQMKQQMESQFVAAQATADGIQKAMAPFDRLELDLTIAADRPMIGLITREVAKEDAGGVKVPPSKGLTSIVPTAAPGGFTIDLPLVGRIRDAMQKAIESVIAKTKAGGMAKADQEALETLAGELTGILKLGRFEAASLVEGDEKGATSITFVRLGPDSQLQKKLEPSLEKSPKKDKMKKEVVDGTTIVSLEDPPKDATVKLASAAIAMRGDLVGMLLSQKPGAAERMKAALKSVAAAKAVEGPGGMKGWVSLVGISKLGDPFHLAAEAKKNGMEEDMKDPDTSKITLDPSPTGHTMEMSMEGFLVKAFWLGAFKDRSAPGGPGAPPVPDTGLPPAPPAPDADQGKGGTSPEASASPETSASPEESAAPDASASPEEEKSEDKDRDKGEEKGDDK